AAAASVAVAAVAVVVIGGLTAMTMTLTAHPGAAADGALAHQALPPAVATVPPAPTASRSSLDSMHGCHTLLQRMCTVAHPSGSSVLPAAVPSLPPPHQLAPGSAPSSQTSPSPALTPAPTTPAAPAPGARVPAFSSPAHTPSPVAVQ